MKFYEVTYIIHSALQEGRLEDIIKSANNIIESNKGKILYQDNWGKKKLAYMIDKQKYGTYMFLQFKTNNSQDTKPLISEFEHNTNVLRYLIISIEENNIIKNKNNLKETTNEVAGGTKETTNEVAGVTKETTNEVAEETKETTNEVAEETKE